MEIFKLKKLIEKTLDINKAQEIISIDLKGNHTLQIIWLLLQDIFKTYTISI